MPWTTTRLSPAAAKAAKASRARVCAVLKKERDNACQTACGSEDQRALTLRVGHRGVGAVRCDELANRGKHRRLRAASRSAALHQGRAIGDRRDAVDEAGRPLRQRLAHLAKAEVPRVLRHGGERVNQVL
eukprot:CAMPEP_0180115126 /NCGR_PEP_ID=MMETSP0985-20121206/37686_1 /TAXON_ID=483367 /ORGANISM="non described non described, Strain CCMP 2436" /LENGTH=129 /DNA_ID=CAMNT_0022053749 /DNA_START=202 /DNA_END=590 /DNA_ORIENTATION=-